jgi:twitching motility protein PilT
MEKIANEERGLIIVTGTTGSGKSTTLAAIVDFINRNKARHIITVEDPLEYMHEDISSYINQREISIDTLAFANAMRAALREDPDVILVGEMRDLETMEICLSAAETGHLVLTTLHTLDAQESINRMLTIFPPHQHNQVRYQLAQVLKAIISQRLVPTADGKGRVPAAEILIATERIKDLISDPQKTWEIRQAIHEGSLHYGMQTFDQCLYNLYKSGMITYDEAMSQATNRNDLAMRIEGITSGSGSLIREETFGRQTSK